jgi:hypothetical protein
MKKKQSSRSTDKIDMKKNHSPGCALPSQIPQSHLLNNQDKNPWRRSSSSIKHTTVALLPNVPSSVDYHRSEAPSFFFRPANQRNSPPRRYLTAASEPTILAIVKQASKPPEQKHNGEQGAQPIPDVGHIEHTKDCTANFKR